MKNSFTETKKSKSRSAFARATDKAPTAPFDWWLFTIVLVILAVGLAAGKHNSANVSTH